MKECQYEQKKIEGKEDRKEREERRTRTEEEQDEERRKEDEEKRKEDEEKEGGIKGMEMRILASIENRTREIQREILQCIEDLKEKMRRREK